MSVLSLFDSNRIDSTILSGQSPSTEFISTTTFPSWLCNTSNTTWSDTRKESHGGLHGLMPVGTNEDYFGILIFVIILLAIGLGKIGMIKSDILF